ncbi:anti-phage DNA glycosylase Brig1 [Ilumatobacter coccineus]|uniref:Uncharacterized protein n=1 Tax=Ilumatobacter coccineus (strain NBRC 103263 / KCTC 29153 / YM16-304) TaxID=1313172 RepID=A0A6C7EEP4_ILUCY|nr:hypothetical protein [Ilumatobacter coccineus]BAN04402.1 hypothetical protein YM304_40880 [Ilumatobacter coccineus YM16-304]
MSWHDDRATSPATADNRQPFGSAVERIQAGWNQYIERFLSGGGAVPPDLERWAESYQGTGTGAVEWDALPEPYLGDLRGDVRGVFLALNPGEAVLEFQGRDGVFADEIRGFGSYSDWASSWAYLRDPWVEVVGPNRHHRSRLKFLRRWVGEPTLPASAMVGFELYPWHSKAVKGAMRPPAAYVREWVWEPIAELDAPVFAFGAAWFDVLEHGLGLRVVARLGPGGEDYGSAVESRAVLVLRDEQTGVTVIAEKHMGSAGPPNADETDLLRAAVGRYTAT